MAFKLLPRHGDMSSMSGMDLGNATTETSMSGMMIGYIHAGIGDTLWFDGWTPATAAATFGACVGLFFLASISRLLAAIRRSADVSWRIAALARRQAVYAATALDTPSLTKAASAGYVESQSSSVVVTPQRVAAAAPPFVAGYDIPRGVIQMVQAFISYLLMLACVRSRTSFADRAAS